MAEWLSDSPIASWLRPWQVALDSRTPRIDVSGTPHLDNMVHCKEKGLGFTYARGAGGRWTWSWWGFYICGSSYDMQIADWEGDDEVASVDFFGEYCWRVGKYSTEQLSRDNQQRTGVVAVAESEFNVSLPFSATDNTPSGSSNTDFNHWTNPGGHYACSGRDVYECQWEDDIWNWFPSGEHVALGNANLTQEYLNTSRDKPEYELNIHIILYDFLTPRVKPSNNCQLLYCLWSFGIFGEFQQ